MQATNIIDINVQNFQQVILEGSREKPVIVEFWAEGHEPCIQTATSLQKLASEFGEYIILARIDCATEQQIAMQFGVQSLPTVAVFKDGQGVDGLVGPQTEDALRELVQKFVPKEHELLLKHAQDLLTEGDFNGALPLLSRAHELAPELAIIRLTLTDACIQAGRLDLAEDLLKSIRLEDQDSYYQQLVSALELKQQAADSPEIRTLQQQVLQHPDNLDLKQQLAVQLSDVGRAEEAMKLLFDVLKKDLNALDGAVKKSFMDILATQPDGDALATSYRRKLYSLLY
ncbi:thioredoxin family protein [Echinimonas agarilytica]|uniref:Co-chaperone YbbN n=1 Tax=Echinimonas agarilytica TaxID=1215918 RepID=A0AA41W8Z0_9GAMM|nr:co-chaperone YbbN [Echinimonas agarilytica]MCM2681274.1 co-chaperone YbbN [Echinimonas agarilytica]